MEIKLASVAHRSYEIINFLRSVIKTGRKRESEKWEETVINARLMIRENQNIHFWCVFGEGVCVKKSIRSLLSRSDETKPSILGSLLGNVGFMRYTHIHRTTYIAKMASFLLVLCVKF